MLRSQSQAEYSPDNIGHFGLALPRYAHFTSPIRRYADLLVHRALIAAGSARRRHGRWPRHSRPYQRDRAPRGSAEREAIERYLAAFMASRIGAAFPARVTGVQRFGIFVTLTGEWRQRTGAGQQPARCFLGIRRGYPIPFRPSHKLVYRLGQQVDVRLVEASALTGGMLFAIAQPTLAAPLMRSALTFLLVLLVGPAGRSRSRIASPAKWPPPCSAPRWSSSRLARSRRSASAARHLGAAGHHHAGPDALADRSPTGSSRCAVATRRCSSARRRPPTAPKAGAGWSATSAATAWTNSPAIQAGGSQTLITTFFDELFNHLDPYSRYVAPEAADEDRARRSGEAGAGLLLSQVRQNFVVQTVNADGPAAEAGSRGRGPDRRRRRSAHAGEDLDTVLGWISGLEGTDVTLTVRSRTGRVRKVELERVVLPPETVFGSRSGDIILLRISGFSSDTDQRFGRELERQLGRPGAAS